MAIKTMSNLIKVRALYIVFAILAIHLAREMYISLAIYQHLQNPTESYYLAYIPTFFIFLFLYFLIKKKNSQSQLIPHFSFNKISPIKIITIGVAIGLIDPFIYVGILAFCIWIISNLSPDLAAQIFKLGSNKIPTHHHHIEIIFLVILVQGVLIPVYEELYCRALLINAIAPKYGFFCAASVSLIFFTVMHKPMYIPSVFFGGLIYTFLYLKYHNILLPIIGHGISNIILYIYQVNGGLNVLTEKTVTQSQDFSSWNTEISIAIIGFMLLMWIICKERLHIFPLAPETHKD